MQEAGVREQETRKEGEPTAGVTELVIAAGSGARSCQTRSEVLYQERLRIVSLRDGAAFVLQLPSPGGAFPWRYCRCWKTELFLHLWRRPKAEKRGSNLAYP